jgi:hypothetical protein
MRIKHAVPARHRLPGHRLLGAAAIPGLLLIIAAAVAGCSGSSSSSSADSSASAPAASAASASAAAPLGMNGAAAPRSAAGFGSVSSAGYVPTGEQLIYTAQLTVRAASVDAAVSRATSIVTTAGGYVSAENATAGQGQPSQATATVTFKIPVAAYSATLASLSGAGLGTQLSLSQQAQDVTQEVADTSSRVISDEAAITQLRALLKRAGSVSSLLSVQNQIDSQESDLESMLAQQSALNHETTYATVTLTLVGPKAPVVKHVSKTTPPPGLAGGLAGGWRAFRLTVSWLLTVIGAVAPFAAAILAIGALTWWGRRRLLRGRRGPTT